VIQGSLNRSFGDLSRTAGVNRCRRADPDTWWRIGIIPNNCIGFQANKVVNGQIEKANAASLEMFQNPSPSLVETFMSHTLIPASVEVRLQCPEVTRNHLALAFCSQFSFLSSQFSAATSWQ
jgi:hypothetical protein